MDYKFLDKVLDQIVRETRIDYDKGEIQFPFLLLFSVSLSSFVSLLRSSFFRPLSGYFLYFSESCKNIYGLNEEEIEYVWDKYRNIIKDKIEK